MNFFFVFMIYLIDIFYFIRSLKIICCSMKVFFLVRSIPLFVSCPFFIKRFGWLKVAK